VPGHPAPRSGAATPEALQEYERSHYGVLATRGEARVGLGQSEGQLQLDEAYVSAPKGWMRQSTEEQIAKLRPLLEASPLRWVQPGPRDP
jgi:hypothetical protein